MLTLIIIITATFLILCLSLKSTSYKLPPLTLEIEGCIDYKALDEENKKIQYGYPNIRGFTRNEHLVCIYEKLEKLENIAKFSQESGRFPAFGTGKMIRISGNSEKAYNLLVNLSKRLHEDDLYVFEHYIIDKIIPHNKDKFSKDINN